MNRDAVFELIRDHLADELDIDPARVQEGSRFKCLEGVGVGDCEHTR